MPRVKQATVTPLVVHVIDPHGIYFLDAARQLLRLKESSLRRECREGRLRVAQRCGRNFVLGKWLLEWLESAPPPRRAAVGCEWLRKNDDGEHGNGKSQP
jgi:hypothetical protein